MATETECDTLEMNFKPNYKELKRWKKTLDKYKDEFDTQYFNTQCYIMNLLNDDKIIIANKSNLYFNFKLKE